MEQTTESDDGALRRLARAPVARSVALGMFLMALFTTIWAAWIPYGLPLVVAVPLLTVFVLLAALFVVSGVGLARASGRFPQPDAQGRARGRRIQKGFGIIAGVEGVIIGGVCALLGARGEYAYFGPAIALVVGLHFLPMGVVFRRTIDYYVGAWVTLVALAGLWLIRAGSLPPPLVGSLVAVATAAATAAYGLYQMRLKHAMMALLADPARL